MVRLLVIGALLGACSPALRATGRCPGFAPQLTDTLIAGAGIGGAVWAFNDGYPIAAAALVTGAMTVALAAALTGAPCTR